MQLFFLVLEAETKKNVAFLYEKGLLKQSLFMIWSQLFLLAKQKCFEWLKMAKKVLTAKTQ